MPFLKPGVTYHQGSGSQADMLQKFLAGVQAQQGAARGANVGRYDEILGEHKARRQRAMDRIGKYRGAREKKIRQDYENMKSKVHGGERGMVARGLTGSTIEAPILSNIEEAKQFSIDEWMDRMLDREMQSDVGLTGEQLGFMERRTDAYPDASSILDLARQYGSAFGAGGGGGGGGGTGASVWKSGKHAPAYMGLGQSGSYLYQAPETESARRKRLKGQMDELEMKQKIQDLQKKLAS